MGSCPHTALDRNAKALLMRETYNYYKKKRYKDIYGPRRLKRFAAGVMAPDWEHYRVPPVDSKTKVLLINVR